MCCSSHKSMGVDAIDGRKEGEKRPTSHRKVRAPETRRRPSPSAPCDTRTRSHTPSEPGPGQCPGSRNGTPRRDTSGTPPRIPSRAPAPTTGRRGERRTPSPKRTPEPIKDEPPLSDRKGQNPAVVDGGAEPCGRTVPHVSTGTEDTVALTRPARTPAVGLGEIVRSRVLVRETKPSHDYSRWCLKGICFISRCSRFGIHHCYAVKGRKWGFQGEEKRSLWRPPRRP